MLHKEQIGPKQVDGQLGDVQPQQDITVAPLRPEHEPHGRGHGCIEQRPRHWEEPARRGKDGLCQAVIKGGVLLGQKADDSTGGQRPNDQHDQGLPGVLLGSFFAHVDHLLNSICRFQTAHTGKSCCICGGFFTERIAKSGQTRYNELNR